MDSIVHHRIKIPVEEDYTGFVCRFCMLPCAEKEVLRIPWNKWQDSLLAAMYERIMNQELFMSKDCPEFCCNECSQLLSKIVNALDMFQKSDAFWRESLTVPKLSISEDRPVAEHSKQQDSSLIEVDFDDFRSEFKYFVDNQTNTVIENIAVVNEKMDSFADIPKIEAIKKEQGNEDVKMRVKSSKRMVANEAPFPCSHCDELCRTKYCLILHMKKTHGLKICMRCNFTAPNSLDIKRHDRAEHKRSINSITPCTRCSKVFTDPNQLYIHMKKVHEPIVESRCHVCSKVFRSQQKLRQHIEIHSDPTFECDICSRKFRLKKYITWHIQHAHIKDTKYICTKCGKNFYDYSVWKKHEDGICSQQLKAQSMRRKYSCNLCEWKYSSLSSGRKHYRNVHRIADMSILCTICNHLASSTDELNEHQSKMHFELRCTVCKRFYNSDVALKLHIATHSTKERLFECSICQATFVKLTTLKAHHTRAHTTERPFKCTDCDLRFIANGEMKAHWRHKHDSNRKMKCQLCEKRFVTMSALRVHEEIHTGIGQRRCDICLVHFRHMYQLNTHMEQQHPGSIVS